MLRNRRYRLIIVSLFELFLLGCSNLLSAHPGKVDVASQCTIPSRSLSDHGADFTPFKNYSGGDAKISADLHGNNPQKEISYENTTLTEDVTWSGLVVVRGYLVIASQTTVRIEPGTVVRFMKSPILRQMPRLVVMGRIDCRGLPGQPVLFAPNDPGSAKAGWEGVLLLSSEKRNHLEHLRVEGAVTGIEARFSNFSMTDVTVTKSRTGMLMRDSVTQLTRVTLDNCDTGLEAFGSELELLDGTLAHNRRGVEVVRCKLSMQGVKVSMNRQRGITAAECRIRFVSCEIAGNGSGAYVNRGMGQIMGTRFVGNRLIGLDLVASRLMIRRSLFADTDGDAVRMDDGQSLILESAFHGNRGYNLVNHGREIISAVLNWWGSFRETEIADKLFDADRDAHYGKIIFSPWLPEKPAQ